MCGRYVCVRVCVCETPVCVIGVFCMSVAVCSRFSLLGFCAALLSAALVNDGMFDDG